MPRARILIKNRPGVFDPQGEVVRAGLERLGHEDIRGVRVGKVIDLEFEAGNDEELRARVDEMCQRFLVNPVIEDYSVEFFDE